MGRLNGPDGKVQYSKLQDDTLDSFLKVMPAVPEYLSFCCKHCGHTQIFQAIELEMILRKSLKMAFMSQKKTEEVNSAGPEEKTSNILSLNRIYRKNMPTSSKRSEDPNLGSSSSTKAPLSAVPEDNFSHNFNVLETRASYKAKSLSTNQANISSDENTSPTELNSFKRIVEKPSLIKLIGKGLAVNVSDEEGYPLVTRSDTSSSIPGSQTNISDLGAGDASRIIPKRAPDDNTFPPYGSSDSSGEFGSGARHIDTLDTSVFHKIGEGELRMAPWFQEGIPREIALEILSQEPIGSFMVRRSTTKLGCFALSVRVPRTFQPRGIAHYLITRTNKGYRIKGFTKEFPTLASLIAHHSVMPELLPCPLSLSRYHPMCIIADSRREFADVDRDPDG